MVNEPKGLRLPREVLIAQEIASSEEPQMSMIFEKSPWFDGKLSFARVRYRNDRGEVIRIVGSWAPASLLPLSALADCDDERVLGLILKSHGNRAAAAYSDEAVDVIQATDADAVLFEFGDGNSFLIHSCSLYCNALDESLLCQSVLMTTNHRLFLRRAVGWDMAQPHGSGARIIRRKNVSSEIRRKNVSSEILVAVIAATPPTIGAVLGYIASKRSLKRSIGANPGMPLRQVLAQMEARFETRFDRLESKIDRTGDEHAGIRERLARLEVERVWPEGRRR